VVELRGLSPCDQVLYFLVLLHLSTVNEWVQTGQSYHCVKESYAEFALLVLLDHPPVLGHFDQNHSLLPGLNEN
jgi:hypothetical protein